MYTNYKVFWQMTKKSSPENFYLSSFKMSVTDNQDFPRCQVVWNAPMGRKGKKKKAKPISEIVR